MDALIALAIGLAIGFPIGWAAERRHLRAWIDGVRAANTATTGDHRQQVLATWARRLRGAR